MVVHTQVKCQAGYRRDPCNPTQDPRWEWQDPALGGGIPPFPLDPTWDFRRVLCILPKILVGIYISHLQKYCFAVFILAKHFCESSNTYGSSTHSANIWHADKTEVVTVPFEKIHLLNDFFNLLYLKL